MFADLERYKALEKEIEISSIVNQFSGLVYIPALTYVTFESTLKSAGTVTINVDNATCTLQGSATIYPAYFIPGHIGSEASLSVSNTTFNNPGFEGLFDKEVLVTHLNPSLWYPNNYPDASWRTLRQNPFNPTYAFHIGTSKTYGITSSYYQYNNSGIFFISLLESYKPPDNVNVDVKVSSSSMTYEPYTASGSGIQSLPKNTVINYVKRFPNRLI